MLSSGPPGRAQKPQREEAGLRHLLDERSRQTPFALDVGALFSDLRRQRASGANKTFAVHGARADGIHPPDPAGTRRALRTPRLRARTRSATDAAVAAVALPSASRLLRTVS